MPSRYCFHLTQSKDVCIPLSHSTTIAQKYNFQAQFNYTRIDGVIGSTLDRKSKDAEFEPRLIQLFFHFGFSISLSTLPTSLPDET